MRKILITGGSGFIGTNLVQYYLERGDEVLNIDISPPGNKVHDTVSSQVDILDRESLIKAVKHFDPDYIFHMAARTDLNGKNIDDYKANTVGVLNLINAARSLVKLKRVLFASSMLVCRIGYRPKDEFDYCPNTAYGESKVLGEEIIRANAKDIFSWVIVRPTSIWGPWFDIPYKSFFTAVKKGIYFHPKGRKIKRTYGFVLNSVFQLHKLANCTQNLVQAKTFYLADYEPVELKPWADMIQTSFGARKIYEVPLGILKIGAVVGDALRFCGIQNPPLSSFRLNNLLTEMVFDMEPLKSICGILPYDTKKGVQITVEWMRKH